LAQPLGAENRPLFLENQENSEYSKLASTLNCPRKWPELKLSKTQENQSKLSQRIPESKSPKNPVGQSATLPKYLHKKCPSSEKCRFPYLALRNFENDTVAPGMMPRRQQMNIYLATCDYRRLQHKSVIESVNLLSYAIFCSNFYDSASFHNFIQ
jgi:hypothetical protein